MEAKVSTTVGAGRSLIYQLDKDLCEHPDLFGISLVICTPLFPLLHCPARNHAVSNPRLWLNVGPANAAGTSGRGQVLEVAHMYCMYLCYHRGAPDVQAGPCCSVASHIAPIVTYIPGRSGYLGWSEGLFPNYD